MNRSEFFQRSAQVACGACAALILGRDTASAAEPAAPVTTPVDEELKRARYENQFTNNWLSDLFDTIDAEVDPVTKLKLMQGCGRGCFRRHKFKQDIAEAGKGDVDKLIAAYEKNFLIWRETGTVHIAYGTEANTCFCPAAKHRPARPNDLHCECTRATHQTVWETAMGKPYNIELVETVRRGGSRCHLVVHLS